MKKTKQIIAILCTAVIVIIPFLKKLQPLEQDGVELAKCTDGDTAHFIIDGKDTTVRFLAIDTPETKKPNTPVQPFGKEASKYTCDALQKADVIRLEYEADKTDKYGRYLAWVFVDDQLLQEKLVQKGYAKVTYIYGDYKYTDTLQKAERKAKTDKIGLWNRK